MTSYSFDSRRTRLSKNIDPTRLSQPDLHDLARDLADRATEAQHPRKSISASVRFLMGDRLDPAFAARLRAMANAELGRLGMSALDPARPAA